MKYFVVFLALLFAVSMNAQTRRIGHRSHSGSVYTSGDHSDGNYGEPYFPPYRIVHRVDTIHMESGKDSVVALHDTTIIEADTLHRMNKILMPYEDAHQLGMICGKFTTRNL